MVEAVAVASVSLGAGTMASASAVEHHPAAQQVEQRFEVSGAVVESDQILDLEGVKDVIDGKIQPEMSLSELQGVAADATAWLRTQGYAVAQVTLPAQTLRDGTVTFKVLPGVLDTVEMKNHSRVSNQKLQRLVDAQVRPDEAITQADLERAFLLASDLSGTGRVNGALSSGTRQGTSRLSLEIPRQNSLTGGIGVDNYGNRYTGESRVSGDISWNNPTGSGDAINAAVVVTEEEMYYGQIGYEMRPGSSGVMLGASLVNNQYELGEEFSALDATGESTTATVFAKYPLVRGIYSNVFLSGSVGHRRLEDSVGFSDSTVKKTANVASLGFAANRRDRWLGGGQFDLNMSYTAGDLKFDTPFAEAIDELGPETAGSYGKWQADPAH